MIHLSKVMNKNLKQMEQDQKDFVKQLENRPQLFKKIKQEEIVSSVEMMGSF